VFWFSNGPVTADLAAGASTGEGTDTLSDLDGLLGSTFGDHLIGDGGDNLLDGDEGDDELDAGGGEDLLVGGLGNDDMDGGAGDYDRADFRTGERLVLDLVAGTATGDGDDHIVHVEGAAAGEGRDKLKGDGEVNYLNGNGGPDLIKGGGGGDFLNGGAGDDEADGGKGTDSCRKFEGKVSCEGAESPEDHPVEDETGPVDTLRRNF
jgi:Ca2+-binding RTX toxin-like protein